MHQGSDIPNPRSVYPLLYVRRIGNSRLRPSGGGPATRKGARVVHVASLHFLFARPVSRAWGGSRRVAFTKRECRVKGKIKSHQIVREMRKTLGKVRVQVSKIAAPGYLATR